MNNLIFGWIAIPISILLGLAMTNPLSAQEAGMEENNAKFITEEIPVRGVCKMCKKRIEGAAMVPGVKLAQWSQNEQMLTVTFKKKKTNRKEITGAILAAGHDAGLQKADPEAYENLPGCCQYHEVEPH